MRPDVIDLRNFYHGHLGQSARRIILRRIKLIWPDLSNLRLLGLGYATPYLYPYKTEAERVLALMPAQQGIIHWPHEGPGRVGLTDESDLPLADSSIDRVLWVHGMEHSYEVDLVLKEIWRVLTSTGKLLVIVPNRRGMWARLEKTPFGHGHPYSDRQLERVLRDNMFSPGTKSGALYMPPSNMRLNMRLAEATEKIGSRWWESFSGVRLIEAEKQVYALSGPLKVKQRRRRPVIVPAARPISPASSRQARL